ncbi:MAG: hypothetical protein FJX60_07845 [Alphaproteobacteria bacterium]|nr:hypothetical protein [Alphaproteobacteria bacterium]
MSEYFAKGLPPEMRRRGERIAESIDLGSTEIVREVQCAGRRGKTLMKPADGCSETALRLWQAGAERLVPHPANCESVVDLLLRTGARGFGN